MAETANRKYPFPTDADEADVPDDLAKLAEAVDRDVAALTADTGWIDINPGNWSPTTDGARYRRKAGVVYIDLNYFPANYPDDALLAALLPAGFRPKYLKLAQSRYQGVPVEIAIFPNGRIQTTEPTTSGIAFSTSFPID
ncbi:hypothetical protein DOU02_06740 [Clavibacter michiganensis subsp. michiganensis]|uniref:hypothetical protein n=1 Tax=Clavibacter michiganensis TaxID=28447 RepID=UPI001303AC68|nr:hypothetical protein [Clavibacter michiganensis]KAF0258775.1 hypothetical protein DOU02_06740 [Clavibacter michiganensis subsp. michiganensis]